jgi:hypothetical protein
MLHLSSLNTGFQNIPFHEAMNFPFVTNGFRLPVCNDPVPDFNLIIPLAEWILCNEQELQTMADSKDSA